MESEGDSSDEDTDGTVNNLSGKQLQATAQARVTLASQAQEDNEGDEQSGFVFYSKVINLLRPLDAGSCSNPALGLRKKNKEKVISNKDLQPSFPPFTLTTKFYKDGMLPEEYFELFFDEEVMNFITNMFNLYALQDKGDFSFCTNPEEIKSWLGILMLTGYVSYPRWRMMWEYHFEAYLPSVANTMQRNRFEVLKAYTHFADNAKLSYDDKFTKMRLLLTMLNERFFQYAILDEKLCVDESMISYFGRHGAKQFLRGKPICFGYKV